MNYKAKLSWLICISWLTLMTSVAHSAGSNVNGVINGTVVDSDGAAIGGVTVTATNPSNGLSRSVTSDDDGSYSVNVPTGIYNVSSEKAGTTSGRVNDVAVTLGAASTVKLVVGTRGESLEEVIVLGTAISTNTDVASTGLNISIEDIELLPVGRNIESVALLAPGTVSGDSAFGEEKNLVSFGGSSVAENVYYIDGLNVTNFRNGLGGSTVPFEFYQDFQIKTGGYSAEFGRSTGGVFNAVTKRGTNDWKYGLVSYFEPDSLRGSTPDTFFADGRLYDHNVGNKSDTFVTDAYVGGPLIKDKLFFYGLYEVAEYDEEFTTRGSVDNRNLRTIDEDFYGLNIFWNINDQHSLSLTHFSDERTRENDIYGDYNIDANTLGALQSTGFERRGGDNTVLRWDGQITDDFAISALIGKNEYNLTDQSTADLECPNVINSSSLDIPFFASCSGDFLLAEVGFDEREAIRLDAEWQVGNHLIRFGLDSETNTTDLTSAYPESGHYYRYYEAPVGGIIQNGTVVGNLNGDGSDVIYVRDRVFANGGAFETKAEAFYIEDIWTFNDSLTMSIGLRSESFNNQNAEGGTFIELENQLAPRLGLEFDASGGAGTSVFYANWGRYHLPVANNTNARLAGSESFTEEYFLFDGGINPATNAPSSIDAAGRPTTQQLGATTVLSDGSIPDVLTIVDQTIEPMFQDEIILGYNMTVGDSWTVGAKYTNRDLSSAIDDITVLDTGHYVLTNPGTDLVYFDDFNGDGVNEEIRLSAAELGYPEAVRKYKSIELTADRAWDGLWSMNASYTFADSKGNSEGLVKSDNGQDDAGLTTDFDFPALQDGSFGRLPNDREHQLKVRGNYQLTDRILLGANLRYASGRPINRFGVGHPAGIPDYGATYYSFDPATQQYTFNPRGSAGETPSTITLDMKAAYSMELGASEVKFFLDIFNVLDADDATEVFETFESGAAGALDDRFGLPTIYQRPRTVRFGASIRF